MSRRSDPRAVREGSRLFLKLPCGYDWLEAVHWTGFLWVEYMCERYRISPDSLEWCYAEENYGQIVAVFEVTR